MQAIEFEVVPKEGTIPVPKNVPSGVPLRVLLLWDTPRQALDEEAAKRLIASVTEGLTEEDLARPRDLGRGDPLWDT